jgi:hypothetical protein
VSVLIVAALGWMKVNEISIIDWVTQGVRLIHIESGERVADMAGLVVEPGDEVIVAAKRTKRESLPLSPSASAK